MSVIGNLVVNFASNTAPLSRGFGVASMQTKGFAGSLLSMGSSAIGSVSSLAATGAAAAGVGVVIAGAAAAAYGMAKSITEVKAAFGDIDRIAKAADTFGITTEEMVGLEHAAELSGVSSESLATAMKKAQREGTNLGAIADEMATITDPAERAQFAFENLGRQGQDLIPLLAGGGDALRDMMKEGNDLAGFSRVDASKIEEANDSISRMKLAFTGVARDIAISLAPIVDKVAVGVKTLGMFARTTFQHLTPIIEQVGNVLSTVWDFGWSAARKAFGGIFEDAQTTFADVAGFILDGAITAEFAFQNLPDIANLAWAEMKLGAFAFGEDFKHMFGVILPSVVKGFVSTMVNTLPAVWDFIKSGGKKGDIKSILGSIEEGITDTLTDLPERALTPFEQKMQVKLAKMERSIAGDLAGFIDMRRGELLDGLGGGTLNDFSFDDESEAATGQKDDKGPAALERGSSEAFSAIFSAMRQKDPQAALLQTAMKELEELRKMKEELKTIARSNKNPVQLVAGSI